MDVAIGAREGGGGVPPPRDAPLSSRAVAWLAVAYPVSLVAALLLKPSIRIPSVLFPPFAIESAALLLLPRRRWPWIALFAVGCDFGILPVVARVVTGHFPPLGFSLGLSWVTTAIALGMAMALQLCRVAAGGFPGKRLTAVPSQPWLLALGALPGAFLSTWLHAIDSHQSLPALETVIRCLSATLTVVALCPLLFGWLQGFDEPSRPLAGILERCAMGATFAASLALLAALPWQLDRFLELMLLAAPLLWVSLRGSHRDAATGCALVALGIGVACSHGLGRFPPLVALGSWRDGVLSVQVFLLITCTEALLVNRSLLEQRALLEDSVRKQAQLVAYGKALDEAEESTRRAAARDLHDGVAQIIAGQGMLLDVLRKRMQEWQLHELLDQVIVACREAQSAVRATIEDLSPPELDRADTADILSWLADHFWQRYRFKVNRRTTGELTFQHRHARLVYRAVRELIYNAYKHAQVEAVDVDIASDATGTVVSVSDAGVGFDPDTPAVDGRRRHGLKHLAERVAAVHGHLDVRAAVGLGCRVTLFLPARPPGITAEDARSVTAS